MNALVAKPTPANDPAPFTDGLTGLADRRAYLARVQRALDGLATRGAERPGVLMLDLDRFKPVNDGFGHAVGDALLAMVAGRLRSAVRKDDLAARVGGDEFAVLVCNGQHAAPMAERLIDLVSRPYLVHGHALAVGASVGLALAEPDDTPDTLTHSADLALYRAKAEKRGSVRVFDQSMRADAAVRQALQADLRRALALGQFELMYQPQVELQTRRLTGFEALLRWRHPERGLVGPDDFIPVAEEIGLITPIGEWVLRTACLAAASWESRATIAVNASPLQLEHPSRFLLAVGRALAESGLQPSRLEIEITESALLARHGTPLDVLRALQQRGVRISMDDFGTGYSSLGQLRSFPFDKLKIDRSFVSDLGNSVQADAMVRAVAALGGSLGMVTVAEGVETEAQARFAAADGCTTMQGYLISRPVAGSAVAAEIVRLGQHENAGAADD